MIEDSKVVKSITSKSGGKSGTYWTITWADDKKDNIFNADWLPLLEQSQKEKIPLNFTKEKSQDGKYYNIKTLELGEPIFEEETTKGPNLDIQSKIRENMEWKQANIEKSFWWKEVGENFRAGLFKKDDNGAGSYLWRAYVKQMLTSLEITIPKEEVKESKLIQEAKKLGATEVK